MSIHPRTQSSKTLATRRKFITYKHVIHNVQKSLKFRDKRFKIIPILIKTFIFFSFLLLLLGSIVAILFAKIVAEASKDVNTLNIEMPFANMKSGDSYIYSKDNVLLRRLSGLESKDFVHIKDIPDYVKGAFVAAEDQTFYENSGVDLMAIVRAFFSNIFNTDSNLQGGSTITQQVVKITLVGNKQDFMRKIKEIILAVQINKKYSKDEILQLYLNSISFGSNFVGIKRAAKAYFNKEPNQLTYAEAALIAGIPNEPSKLAPAPYNSNKDDEVSLNDGSKVKANIMRQREILDRMDQISDRLYQITTMNIDKNEIRKAYTEPVIYHFTTEDMKAPHLVQNGGPVMDELHQIFADKENPDAYITSGGLRIYTTLDYQAQQWGEEEMAKIDNDQEKIGWLCGRCGNNTRWGTFGAKNGMLVSVEVKTGAVISYVGSKNFNAKTDDGYLDGQVDMIRSPVSQGSSMKSFTYLNTFVNKQMAPSAVWANFSLDFGGKYRPKNFSIGDRPSAAVSSEWALRNSLNIPAAQALLTGGVDNYANLLQKMGYNDFEVNEIKKAGVTATLGAAVVSPLSHAQAYQVIANSGVKQKLYFVEKVLDNDGNIVYEKQKTKGEQIINVQHSWLVIQMLQKYSTVQNLRNQGYDAAGKTGTNDFGPNGLPTSIVFWGFTPEVLTGVWAGNNNNKPLRALAVGEKLGQVFWTPYMSKISKKYPNSKYSRPPGIVDRLVCTDTGFLASQNSPCPKASAVFWEKELPKLDHNHQSIWVVSCGNGLALARAGDISSGRAFLQYFVNYETPTGSSLIQKQIDEFARTKLGQTSPPRNYCN